MTDKVAGPVVGCGKTSHQPTVAGKKKEISYSFECKRIGGMQ